MGKTRNGRSSSSQWADSDSAVLLTFSPP